jgi:uncharacterized protein YndB with AHSA1/START domain
MADTKNGAETGLPEMHLTRRFAALREMVFRVWIDPKQLKEWWVRRGSRIPCAR